MLKKVACNATNSAAIDEVGNLFTWGSTRYGLAGQPAGETGKGQKDKDVGGQPSNILKPLQMPLFEADSLAQSSAKTVFSAFHLLDPDPKSKNQVNCAMHLSFGSYHAGVVCNDVYTNFEFVPLQQAQQEILMEVKDFLMKYWDVLEKQNSPEILAIQQQYFDKQKSMRAAITGSQRKMSAKMMAMTVMKGAMNKGSINSQAEDDELKLGEVSDQLKLEYMLRFFFQTFLRSCFPLVPLGNLKSIMAYQAKISFKDTQKINKFLKHFVKAANDVIASGSFAPHRAYLKEVNPNDDYVNLKELRDQLMGRRCSNGKLFMFGVSNEGRLGVSIPELEHDSKKDFNMCIKGLSLVQFQDPATEIIKVECGSSFTLVLTAAGTLFSWGFGKSGSLGLGEVSFCSTPQQIETLYSGDKCQNMIDISCGSSHSLSIDKSGIIYSWGNGQGGRLGHNQEVGENSPRQIDELAGKQVKQIEAGDASSCCITSDSIVYLWGSGLNGRLGNGTSSNVLIPSFSQELKDLSVITMIKGTNTAFAILESRQVMGWGSSKNGKLGFPLANGKNYDLPKEIVALTDFQVYQIAAGPFHTLLLTIDGKMLSMGNSKDGKLGYEVEGGGVVDIEQPERIRDAPRFFSYQTAITIMKKYPLFNDYNDWARLKPIYTRNKPYEINMVCCGEAFQLFLTNNGEMYACGSNKHGQLGVEADDNDEEEDEEDEPDEDGPQSDQKDDSVFLPKNLQKKIGDLEKRQDQWLPQQVPMSIPGTNKVRYIAVGTSHCVAILENDNGVFSWGRNNFGQLGIGGQKVDQMFSPTKIKTFNSDMGVRQAACGENHSVFLMANGSVMTCGSNEFGQLGLFQDAAIGDGAFAQGGIQEFTTPTLIEKSYLDGVTFISAGRFHTLVIKKQSDNKDDDGDKPIEAGPGGGPTPEVEDEKASMIIPSQSQSMSQVPEFDENGQKIVTVDINHELYGWGRGYHGQLGIKDLKVVQWTPKKIHLKKDPRYKDEDQPTRFAMISCGEKHSLALAVNGMIWWAGEKKSVGVEDPNLVRKNRYESKVERDSYQYTFMPYFDPNQVGEFSKLKIKYLSANFNSRTNFAITEQNEICQFGENVPFQKLATVNKFVYADSGKNFQTLIHIERLPYTWGDIKNGRLGIDLEDQDILESDLYVRKERRFRAPCLVPHFDQILRQEAGLSTAQEDYFRSRYYHGMKQEEDDDESSAEINNFDLRFPIQVKLKAQDQEQVERDLIQQDTDLIQNFKSCIRNIYDGQQEMDVQMRSVLMNAQDSIVVRIQTFPIPNVEKLEDINLNLPKVLLLNKQIYEVMFTLLQTHPCYLIRWLCAAARQDIDLFDDHPLAFFDEDEDAQAIQKAEAEHQSFVEQQILYDEFCYLLLTVFGGLKNIRNERRIVNMLMVIGIKTFEWEVNESASPNPTIDYDLHDILSSKEETVFARVYRLSFQAQYQNTSFSQEIFDLIVKRLFRDRKLYTDGMTNKDNESQGAFNPNQSYDVFDYESTFTEAQIAELRATNLLRFIQTILKDIIVKNLNTEMAEKKVQRDCEHFFSNEAMLMAFRARQVLLDKVQAIQKKNAPNVEQSAELEKYQEQCDLELDQVNQFMLRLLFEDLWLRLQHLKPHDVIKLIGLRAYEANPIMNVIHKRNNFFFIGSALKVLFTGEKMFFTGQPVESLKSFLECRDFDFRGMVTSILDQQVNKSTILNFNQVLIQQTIEQAIEPMNAICTVQLRNIVYIHNQLVRYGENNIFIKGFASENILDGSIMDGPESFHGEDEDEASESLNESKVSNDGGDEMDPLKMILDQLGDQYIILRVLSSIFISQDTLHKSVNLLIRTRIFENYSEIIRCADCCAVVYQGIIPKQRFQEGLNMKQWICGNPKCKFLNTVEMSLSCKKCESPRPRQTLPSDLLFPLYVPLNPTIEINRYVTIMERLLRVVPLIDSQEDMTQRLKDIRTKEKRNSIKNFDLINILDGFLNMRQTVIDKKLIEAGIQKFESAEEEEEFENNCEEELYGKLVEKIEQNMERRQEHQKILNRNNQMIKEINEQVTNMTIQQKQLSAAVTRIAKNAKFGIGSDSLLSQDYKDKIFAGRLEELSKTGVKSKSDKEKVENPAMAMKNEELNTYFATMQKKQGMTMNNARLQKKLDDKKKMLTKMKNQFSQFSSFKAQYLIDTGVVDAIKIGGRKMDPMVLMKCSYLFYEIKPDDDNDGGYRVELGFEEKKTGLCGVGLPGGNSNQSVLSTFIITNTQLIEMRRVMATKCIVNLGGSHFNIFKLVKLINQMKTKSQQYAGDAPASTGAKKSQEPMS